MKINTNKELRDYQVLNIKPLYFFFKKFIFNYIHYKVYSYKAHLGLVYIQVGPIYFFVYTCNLKN